MDDDTDNVDEAVREIVHFYKNYHSMRYVKDELVIRLHRTPTKMKLEKLSQEFKDICSKGTIVSSPAHAEETDHLELPRISFHFNRLNCGRLRLLIDSLNND